MSGTDSTGGTVQVLPLNVAITVQPGEAVMSAAQRQGYRWPTVCGGLGTCRTCAFEVHEGAEHLSPVQSLEAEAIEALQTRSQARGHSKVVRLACQARVNGPVVVRRSGVRRRPAPDGETAGGSQTQHPSSRAPQSA